MQKPQIKVCFNSPEGNIFCIQALAAKAIKQSSFADVTNDIRQMIARVEKSRSYSDALAVISEYVTIIPTGGSKYDILSQSKRTDSLRKGSS